jgi:hypothetical protein
MARYKKEKGSFSKGVIVFMLLFLFCFTSANLFLFYRNGTEPSTLITCVFAFCGAEGGYLAFVKKLKEKDGTKNE